MFRHMIPFLAIAAIATASLGIIGEFLFLGKHLSSSSLVSHLQNPDDKHMETSGRSAKQLIPPAPFPKKNQNGGRKKPASHYTKRANASESVTTKKPPIFHHVSLQSYHDKLANRFAETPGFGFQRYGVIFPSVMNDVMVLPKNDLLAYQHQDQYWQTVEFDLVGLSNPKQPLIYLPSRSRDNAFGQHRFPHKESEFLNGVSSQKNPPIYSRDPNTRFEIEAIEKLKSGDSFAMQMQNGRIQMMGALRADKRCTNCHNAKEGDLLGALSYTFTKSDVRPQP